MALVVGGLPPALHQRDELVAHVDEGRAWNPSAQFEREQPRIELERGLEVADLESHVVDSDQTRRALHAAKASTGGPLPS